MNTTLNTVISQLPLVTDSTAASTVGNVRKRPFVSMQRLEVNGKLYL
jgi:hypothetical protein